MNSNLTTWALPEGAMARLGLGSVRDTAFSPDGQYLAIGTDIGLWLYESQTLSPVALWDTERGQTENVIFSPDSRLIATQTFAEDVKVWDTNSGVCIAVLEKEEGQLLSNLRFSPDGQRVLAATNENVWKGRQLCPGKVYVWCAQTGKQINESEIHYAQEVGWRTAFSPDFTLLASTYCNRERDIQTSIVVWNIATGAQIACMQECPARVQSLCFSPCGKRLAVGGEQGTLHVWDWENERLESTAVYGQARVCLHYPPNGELLAAVISKDTVEVWNVTANQKLDTFAHRGERAFACFSENGTQIAVARSSEISVWRKGGVNAQPLSTLHGHLSTVDSLVFSADGKTLAAGMWWDNVLLWDVASRQAHRPDSEELPGRKQTVHPTTSGKILTTYKDGDMLKTREVGNSEPLAEFDASQITFLPRHTALSSTGQRVARLDKEGIFHLWERTAEGTEKHILLRGNPRNPDKWAWSPHGLAFSPDGKRLVTIGRDRAVQLWDVNTAEEIAELPLNPPARATYRESDMGLAFSPRGDIIAGAQWGEIVLWEATDGKLLKTFPQPEGNQRPITLAFSPCGKYLVSGSWYQCGLKQMPIRLWEVATGENIATFHGHTTDVQCIAFSPDGTLMATGGHDGIILLWDVGTYMSVGETSGRDFR